MKISNLVIRTIILILVVSLCSGVASATSNASTYISFTYDEGFSTVMFEVEPAYADGSTISADFSATKRTTNPGNRKPFLQVVGDKIYYVWCGSDGNHLQIWTAEMNTDGTGWNATQRTTTAAHADKPRFQVVGDKIYYAWKESDGSHTQIWTAEMNTDGTGWNAAQRTSSNTTKDWLAFQVVGEKIYYIFREMTNSIYPYISQLWTAEMKKDGTGWNATQRTSGDYDRDWQEMQVVGDKIYYVFIQRDESENLQISTAEMDVDGTCWNATQRTTSNTCKTRPQLQVVGNKTYYVWNEGVWTDKCDWTTKMTDIWTAEMNTDGTGWNATKISSHYGYRLVPQLQVVGNKAYYVWAAKDESGIAQIWTAEMNIDGTGWNATKITSGGRGKARPKFQVVGSKIYYAWFEKDDSGYAQIWTAELDLKTT